MLIFIVAFIAIAVIIGFWCFSQEIHWIEAIGGVVLFSLIFTGIYSFADRIVPSDVQFITGNVVSKIRTQKYCYEKDRRVCDTCTRTVGTGDNKRTETYSCNCRMVTDRYTEPARWYLGQEKSNFDGNPDEEKETTFKTKGDRLCFLSERPKKFYSGEESPERELEISLEKFNRSRLNDITVWTENISNAYLNNSKVFTSYDYFKDKQPAISGVFKTEDYDKMKRIITLNNGFNNFTTDENQQKLEEVNRSLNQTEVSVSIVFTEQSVSAEELNQVWFGGKGNDFIIIISSQNRENIDGIKVIAWENQEIKTRVSNKIKSLEKIQMNSIFQIISEETTNFTATNLDKHDVPMNINWWFAGFGIFFGIIGEIGFLYWAQTNELGKGLWY